MITKNTEENLFLRTKNLQAIKDKQLKNNKIDRQT